MLPRSLPTGSFNIDADEDLPFDGVKPAWPIGLLRSHDILTDERWEGAKLQDVVLRSMEPSFCKTIRPQRFLVERPDARLSPKAALLLAMGLHELATNVAKYGALSTPAGRVAVRWRKECGDGRDTVRLVWHEQNGPPVRPPEGKGFGSRMIQQTLASEVQGKVSLDYAPDGVRFEVLLPLQQAP